MYVFMPSVCFIITFVVWLDLCSDLVCIYLLSLYIVACGLFYLEKKKYRIQTVSRQFYYLRKGGLTLFLTSFYLM